jgi:hypothetical protein
LEEELVIKDELSPEQKLWMATLIRGIRNFTEDSVHRTDATMEAVGWVLERDSGIGSFEWVCTVLGYDSDVMREGLVKYKQRYERVFGSAGGTTLEAEIVEEFEMTMSMAM